MEYVFSHTKFGSLAPLHDGISAEKGVVVNPGAMLVRLPGGLPGKKLSPSGKNSNVLSS